jgi:cytidylate kinase
VIVTISREYGAAGLAVARGVAAALGLELVADEVDRTAAARLGTSSDEVAASESPTPLVERLMRGLRTANAEAVTDSRNPQLDFDETVRREIEEAIRERAIRDDVVFLGRFASVVLAGRVDMLRVFLHAPHAWRVARIAQVFEMKPDDAAREVDRTDAERRRLASERYGTTWGDLRAYDLIIDVGALSIEGAIATVVAAARARRE